MNSNAQGSSALDRLLAALRGEHNSIRYRFYHLPLQKLQYFWSRLTGKSYTEWYAERMDANAAISKDRPLSARYLETAKVQLDYLKMKGLQPQHRLLEYGAGVLRAGILFIDYLEPGKYTGADISVLRLDKGIALANERGIPRNRYRIEVLSNAQAKELGDSQFDYVWSHDVFAHMPLDESEACLIALKRNLAPGGRIFITYSRADEFKTSNLKDFWYTNDQFRQMCERAGYTCVLQKDWEQYRLPESADRQMLVMLTHPNQ